MADSKNSQRAERGPELTLLLDMAEPQKKDGIWEVIATATVLFRRKYAPDPQREVVFFLNDEEKAREETDAESGRASAVIEIPKTGSYIITAFVPGLPGVRGVKRITAKEEKPKPKVPDSLSVSFTGPPGGQLLLISVGAGDGSLIPGFVGVILSGGKVDAFETGPDGTTVHLMNFWEKSRAVKVRVGNKPEHVWRGVLLGPPQPPPLTLIP